MQNNRNKRSPRRDNSRRNDSIQDVMPSSEILEQFEDAVPTSVADLIKMAEKEQKHRHNWQDNYLKSHSFTTRLGQVCGLIYNLFLLSFISKVYSEGDKEFALKIFLGNVVLMAFVALITTFERRVFSRRPKSRIRDDRRRNSDRREKNHSKAS